MSSAIIYYIDIDIDIFLFFSHCFPMHLLHFPPPFSFIFSFSFRPLYRVVLRGMKVKDELGLLLNFFIRRKKEFDKLFA